MVQELAGDEVFLLDCEALSKAGLGWTLHCEVGRFDRLVAGEQVDLT